QCERERGEEKREEERGPGPGDPSRGHRRESVEVRDERRIVRVHVGERRISEERGVDGPREREALRLGPPEEEEIWGGRRSRGRGEERRRHGNGGRRSRGQGDPRRGGRRRGRGCGRGAASQTDQGR